MRKYKSVNGKTVRVKKVRQCEVCSMDFNPIFGYDFECRVCRADESLEDPTVKPYNCGDCGAATVNKLKCKSCWGDVGEHVDNSIYY